MSEATDQRALFDLINRLAGLDALGQPIPGITPRHPHFRYVFHPANERAEKAGRINAMLMGQRSGVWDVWVPFRNRAEIFGYPAETFVGLVIEMKSKNGTLSPEQEDWREFLRGEGWACQVYRDWTQAARVLVRWVGGDPDEEMQGLAAACVAAEKELGK